MGYPQDRIPNSQHRERSDMSLSWAWPLLAESPEFERGAAALQRTPAAVWIEGLAGTAKWFVAAALAERVRPAGNDEAQVRKAFEIVYQREPAAEELAVSREVPIESLCWALLSSNEFLFLN